MKAILLLIAAAALCGFDASAFAPGVHQSSRRRISDVVTTRQLQPQQQQQQHLQSIIVARSSSNDDNNVASAPPSDWQSQILSALSVIIDPDLNSDIVSLGFVQNLNIDDSSVVSLDLCLTTPACPIKDLFVQQ